MWSRDSLMYNLSKFKMDSKAVITEKDLEEDTNMNDDTLISSTTTTSSSRNKSKLTSSARKSLDLLAPSNWDTMGDPHYVTPNKPAKRITKEFGIVFDEMSGLSQVDEIDDLRTLKQKRQNMNTDVGLLDVA